MYESNQPAARKFAIVTGACLCFLAHTCGYGSEHVWSVGGIVTATLYVSEHTERNMFAPTWQHETALHTHECECQTQKTATEQHSKISVTQILIFSNTQPNSDTKDYKDETKTTEHGMVTYCFSHYYRQHKMKQKR